MPPAGERFSSAGASGLTVAFGTSPALALPNTGSPVIFTYSKLLGGFIASGVSRGIVPVEILCEICNRANCGLWVNIPLLYSDASINALAAKIRDALNPWLKCLFELSNEIWNYFNAESLMAAAFGSALGFPTSTNGFYETMYSYQGLRILQMAKQVIAAWTTTRPRSNVIINCPTWIVDGTSSGPAYPSFRSCRLEGTNLVTSNATYAALGGPGGTTGTQYNIYPNRPVDYMDGIGYAPYLNGLLVGGEANSWSGSLSNFAALLQASAAYATGNAAQQASAIAAWNADFVAGFSSQDSDSAHFSGFETQLENYDSGSPNRGTPSGKLNVYLYEGGIQEGLGSNFNGTQSISEYSTLSAQFTSNGWNLSAYGASNDIVAQNVIALFLAFLNSEVFYTSMINLFQEITTAHAGRIAMPAEYGYSGPSVWAIYPADLITSLQAGGDAYQNYYSFRDWNA